MDLSILRQRPAVHMLCRGAFLQETLSISPTLFAVPLTELGMKDEARIATEYASTLSPGRADAMGIGNLANQGQNAHPLLALVVFGVDIAPPNSMETEATPALERARAIASWSAGATAIPFAFVIATQEGTYCRMVPPRETRRIRLGFGNTGVDYTKQLSRIFDAAEYDERFAFALTLFRDALREPNAEFRISRFYACLEALAYHLKRKHHGKSRDAIRDLLGGDDQYIARLRFASEPEITFDRIAIAGRMRDKFFHGASFDGTTLSAADRVAYTRLRKQLDYLADLLQADCELEIARWANGHSRGQPPTGDGD
jgi:hypothetical protein